MIRNTKGYVEKELLKMNGENNQLGKLSMFIHRSDYS